MTSLCLFMHIYSEHSIRSTWIYAEISIYCEYVLCKERDAKHLSSFLTLEIESAWHCGILHTLKWFLVVYCIIFHAYTSHTEKILYAYYMACTAICVYMDLCCCWCIFCSMFPTDSPPRPTAKQFLGHPRNLQHPLVSSLNPEGVYVW